MDVHLIYFDDESKLVKKRYIGSQFMGTVVAKETLERFEEVHGKLDSTHNTIQISIDGPNVNWRMLDLVKDEKMILMKVVHINLKLEVMAFMYYIELLKQHNLQQHGSSYPAGIYLLKVNNRNTRTRCEICSKLTIKTPERR